MVEKNKKNCLVTFFRVSFFQRRNTTLNAKLTRIAL